MTKSVRLAQEDVFARGQCGPDEVVLEQRFAGRSFDFPLTLHDLRKPLVQREGPRRSVTANQPAQASPMQGRWVRCVGSLSTMA
jgi:hypothetical protein